MREKHPIILLEGLDGCGKTSLAGRLQSGLGMTCIKAPPPELSILRPYFDGCGSIPVRRAFFMLGNIMTGEEARRLSRLSPVLIDRYAPSTWAYRAGEDSSFRIPESWPDDLLRPEALIVLEAEEGVRLARLSGRGEGKTAEEVSLESDGKSERVKAAYREIAERFFAGRSLILDTSRLSREEVAERALGFARGLD